MGFGDITFLCGKVYITLRSNGKTCDCRWRATSADCHRSRFNSCRRNQIVRFKTFDRWSEGMFCFLYIFANKYYFEYLSIIDKMRSFGNQKKEQQWCTYVNRETQQVSDLRQKQSMKYIEQINQSIQCHNLKQIKEVRKDINENKSENKLKLDALDKNLKQVFKVLEKMDVQINKPNLFQSLEGKGSRKEQPSGNLQKANKQDSSEWSLEKRRSISVQGGLQTNIVKQFGEQKVQEKIVKQGDKGVYRQFLPLHQQLSSLKKNQQQNNSEYYKQLRDIREKHRIEIQKAQQKILQLQMQIKVLKATHSDKISTIVSNHQYQYQTYFKFIQQQIQLFQNRRIAKIQLLFQSDDFNQNISNYLVNKQSEQVFPFLVLFYSKKQVLFGAYSTHLYRATQGIEKAKGFLFNATKGTAFMAGSRPNTLSSVTLQDNYLYFGNREVSIKNNNLKTVRVCCGVIFGIEYYNVEKRNRLTGQQVEQIQLDNVELHRVYFVK